jgi:hypothetical protein
VLALILLVCLFTHDPGLSILGLVSVSISILSLCSCFHRSHVCYSLCVHLVLVELEWAKLGLVKFALPTGCAYLDSSQLGYIRRVIESRDISVV